MNLDSTTIQSLSKFHTNGIRWHSGNEELDAAWMDKSHVILVQGLSESPLKKGPHTLLGKTSTNLATSRQH